MSRTRAVLVSVLTAMSSSISERAGEVGRSAQSARPFGADRLDCYSRRLSVHRFEHNLVGEIRSINLPGVASEALHVGATDPNGRAMPYLPLRAVGGSEAVEASGVFRQHMPARVDCRRPSHDPPLDELVERFGECFAVKRRGNQ